MDGIVSSWGVAKAVWDPNITPVADRDVSAVKAIYDVTVTYDENSGGAHSSTGTITAVDMSKSVIVPRGAYSNSTNTGLAGPPQHAWEWQSSTQVRVRHTSSSRSTGGTVVWAFQATVIENY